MVGTAKWKEEWISFIHAAKKNGKSNGDIAAELHVRYPRQGKDFNVGGVKYVLTNYEDPILPSNQVRGGGVNKKKKPTKGSQLSIGTQNAMDHVRMGSPATSVASSFDPVTQTRHPVVGGSRAGSFENARPMNTLSSSMPSNNSRDAVANMNSSYNLPGPFAGRQGHQYAAPTPGTSNENPVTIDDDDRGVAHQGMYPSSTNERNNIVGHGQEQHAINPYTMNNTVFAQHMHQQYAQPPNGQIQAATNNQMTQFMSAQTQQVMGGFHNVAKVGSGQGTALNPHGSGMQNSHALYQKQNSPQGPPQVQRPFNSRKTMTGFSTNPNLGVDTSRTAAPNHGLPNYSENLSGSTGYTGNNQPGSHQNILGGQDGQSMMRNVNGMGSVGNGNTSAVTGNRQHAALKKSAEAQNNQNHSSSKIHRPRDDFDFKEGEDDSFFDPEHLGLMPPPLPRSASASRNEPQNQVGMGIAAAQTGAKRKNHQEPARTQMSSVGGASNTMNLHKRQKQDNPDATMMAGSAGQVNNAAAIQRPSMQGNVCNNGNTRRTPQKPTTQPSRGNPNKPYFASNSHPHAQSVGNPADITVQAASMANPSSKTVYNPILLQQYQRTHGGRTPEEEMQKLELTFKALSSSQNGLLNAHQSQEIKEYSERIKQDARSLLQNYPQATPPNLNPLQRGVGQSDEASRIGMPQSALPLEEQQTHYNIMQETLAQSNNRGVSRAPMGQTGDSQRVSQQQLSQPSIGNNNTRNPPSDRKASTNTNGASVSATYQATPYINRADMSTPQNSQVNGHRFNGPPIPRPTPNMGQAAISTSHQGQPYGNGAGVVSNSHLPTNANKAMPGTHQTHTTQNGVNHMQNIAGHLPRPNIGRPNTAPTPVTHHIPNTTSGDNMMQLNTHLEASAPMQKSISLPPPNSRPSEGSRASANLQPPHVHQVQDQRRNQEVQIFADQQVAANTSRSSTPSITNGPYQSPYPSNAGIEPQNAPAQPKMYDQPLHQAVNGAVTGGISVPTQNLGVKSPSGSSKSDIASDQTSSPAIVSPNTAASNGEPSDFDGLLMINLENPTFYHHFTFPSTRDGWSFMLDHFNNDYHVTNSDKTNVILLRNPQFLGGVSWPTGQEPLNQRATLPLPVSSGPQPFVAQAIGPLAPSNQNASVSTLVSSGVPQPTGPLPPVWQAPIAPGVANSNLPKPVLSAKVDRKKPDLHISLDNVSPKTAMRKAGPIQNQTEQGFPELLVEDNDDLGGLFGDGDDLGLSGDGDDLFGEGPDDNQNVSGPSSSAHSGDQTSKQSSGLTLPSPAVGTTQQGGESSQSFLDNAQPARRESSAPKSILQHPNQTSAEASPRHIHFDGPEVEVPKPEHHILTDVNAAEWRARHPIPKMPFWQSKKKAPPLPPPPEEPQDDEYHWDEYSEPAWKTDTSPEGVASNIKMQKWWLESVFPDYPKLDRLDVTRLNRPHDHLTWAILVDQNCTYRYDVSDYMNAVGHVDWDDRGNPVVRAALDMMQYVEKWGELCTKFDHNGKPILTEAPDPSRKEFNKRMAEEIEQGKKAHQKAWEKMKAELEALEEEKKAEEQKARRKAFEEKQATLEKERLAADAKQKAADEEEAAKRRPTMSFMEKLALENEDDLEFW